MGLVHFVYLGIALLVLVVLLLKKEIVLPCIIGIFLVGLAYSKNVISAIGIMYNSIIVSATELLGIIVVIALITTLSKGLAQLGSDELMIRPLKALIRGKKTAFFIVGAAMLIFSWFLWPSPAVALIGALLLPVALKAGLPSIWVAVSMNIFGHGIGLSGDFFIQGAPNITAQAAGVPIREFLSATIPVWLTMSVVVIIVSYIMFQRDMRKEKTGSDAVQSDANTNVPALKKATPFSIFIAVLTPLSFVTDIILMLIFDLRGGDATALVGGTSLLVLSIIMIFKGDFLNNLEEIADYIVQGFQFALKIFAPVVIIAAFFFLGNGEIAAKVLGEGAPNILGDVGNALSNTDTVFKLPLVLIEALVAIITGLDGSGFSGLPIVGAVAKTFSMNTGLSTAYLAALGQVVTIWVGGGTIIPWGVIPVASICNVKAADLARRNLIPVAFGILAAIIVTVIIL
ncbi:transporter [Leadbettera azotonutricia]|uniref:Transporter n=1 Tax=Leadbettera azotonutricia (strain ATCC BAA-888 / DSM 13862 / ZAS-9) TaxID=545695 RepID=F5YF30_LEAAZ|nr:transporter [Leadbettera azotonutricia]AEF83044.1 transporter [Leadbettera azotonutricia ZAS-9]